MRLSCCSAVAGDVGLVEAVPRLRSFGFRRIDVLASEQVPHLRPATLAAGDDAEASALREAVARFGVEVTSINCLLSGVAADPDARERVGGEFLALLEVARQVGCPNMTVQSGGVREGQAFAEAFEAAREGLSWLHSLKGSGGPALSFEPHVGAVVQRPADALRMVRALWPSVGITYDPSHFAMQEVPFEATE
ncbi:MAG: sugar phosphate isomerase/epimerase family protein, partial [Planctomycetota bacterium]